MSTDCQFYFKAAMKMNLLVRMQTVFSLSDHCRHKGHLWILRILDLKYIRMKNRRNRLHDYKMGARSLQTVLKLAS
jgi:hypothetical protein